MELGFAAQGRRDGLAAPTKRHHNELHVSSDELDFDAFAPVKL
jgi:hypothetical protein